MSSTHSKNEETLAVILEEINKKLDEEITRTKDKSHIADIKQITRIQRNK